MRHGLILSLLWITNVASFNPPNCGIPQQAVWSRGRRMIGGRDVDVGTQPWVVLLRQYLKPSMCTGTLISDRHVITTASCFSMEDCRINWSFLAELTVCHGASDLKLQCSGPGETEVKVEEIHFLSDYYDNDCPSEEDMVILTLKQPIPNAVPVCLPILENGPLVYKNRRQSDLFIGGFSDNSDSESLQYGNIRFRSGKISQLLPACPYEGDFICFNPHANNGAAFCWGDYGGPMTEIHGNRHVLVGLNSYTDGECTPDGFNGELQFADEVQPKLRKILSVIGGR